MEIILKWKKFSNMLEIDILIIYTQTNFGFLGGDFEGLGVQMVPRRSAD